MDDLKAMERKKQIESQLRVLDSVREHAVNGKWLRVFVVTIDQQYDMDFGWSTHSLRLLETLGALDMLADKLRRDAYTPHSDKVDRSG